MLPLGPKGMNNSRTTSMSYEFGQVLSIMTFPGDLSGNKVKSCRVQFNKGVQNLQNFCNLGNYCRAAP